MAKDNKSFWSSIPGFFTGLAGVLTAVVGLLTLAYNLGWIGDGSDDGTGPGSPEVAVFDVDPPRLDLSSVKSTGKVTIRNDGDEPLAVEANEITGPDAERFDADDSACTGGPLASGRSCEVEVTFNPGGLDRSSASLVVSADGGARNSEVALEATTTGLPLPGG